MNLSLSDEQAMLRDTVLRYLREHHGFERRRAARATPAPDLALWKGLADLGVLGITLPEEAGGLGLGPVETMLVMEALGATLVNEPILETIVIAASLLSAAGGIRADRLLPAIVSGEARIAFAADEPTSRDLPHHIATRAERTAAGWRIAGEKIAVIGAPSATHWLIPARTSGAVDDRDGISLFLLDPACAGATVHAYRRIDDREAADLRFDRVTVPDDALLGAEGAALPMIEAARAAAIAALCAEAIGVLRTMLEDTIAYTRERRQFGQPLSRFQALQHRMVDMHLALEQAASATYLATLNLGSAPPVRDRAVAAAKATIGRAARFIGENAVQLHGAMGMTEELAVGHYFKRATAIQTAYGSADHHVARYANLVRADCAR